MIRKSGRESTGCWKWSDRLVSRTMFEISEKAKMVTGALLVSVHLARESADEAQSLLDELEALVDTLGVPVRGKMLVKIIKPQAQMYVGTGKAAEIWDHAKELGLDVIVFDNELTPAQQRNWEALSGMAVIDRQEVILDIFNNRAHTREARLQVDLARMEYSLPRLTRAWSHLSKQGGGIGGKGEGESQLETDKRLVRKQIDRIKDDLIKVRAQRATQRKSRVRLPLPNAAIVGYTNAGKSSLLKKLTGADVLVEDKLFATLDTTTRKIELPNSQALLLTDTVGFVRKLPHRLVEAFKATLEEAVLADFLIHVLDASHPEVLNFHQTTLKVLEELHADGKRMITAFNKIDAVTEESQKIFLRKHFPDALFISAQTGEGLDELRQHCMEMLADRTQRSELIIPLDRSDLLAQLHEKGNVLTTSYEDDGIHVQAMVPSAWQAKFAPYLEVAEPGLVEAEAMGS